MVFNHLVQDGLLRLPAPVSEEAARRQRFVRQALELVASKAAPATAAAGISGTRSSMISRSGPSEEEGHVPRRSLIDPEGGKLCRISGPSFRI
jgi:hypothetical protein